MLGKENVEMLTRATQDALVVQDLRNPRVIERIFQRLYLAALGGLTPQDLDLLKYRPDWDPSTPDVPRNLGLRDLILWMGVIDRWPELRVALQDADVFKAPERLIELCVRYKWWDEGNPPPDLPAPLNRRDFTGARSAVVERLPRREDAPELVQIFHLLTTDTDLALAGPGPGWGLSERLLCYDRALVRAGL
jgi:hypothetical protein